VPGQSELRFDGRVAIVTGAGNGLGREHALGLAARGAKVVVNDLGAARDGSGGSSAAAEKVVEDIRAAGGQAIADGANVADVAQVQAMVERAKAEWGRIDILVNNAGILRDKSFAKMELADFRTVVDVHLMGSVHCTKAVWETMRAQNYGRIVMTTSSSGLYGNFGQANYGSAKAGVVGLMNVLAQEGRKNDIRVNTLSPTAATRMTEDLIPPDMLALMTPESITPGVLYLVSEDAPTRTILCAGAGAFAVARIIETRGAYFPERERTPEAIAARFAEIADTAGAEALASALQQTGKFVHMAAEAEGISLGADNREKAP
jgi:NAD(P)-dependent dehydrogenase (short-subunit alcohol dehydrogenase family)